MVSENLCPPEREDSAGMGFYLKSVLKPFIFLKLRGLLFKACLSKLPLVPCRKSFFKRMVSTKNRTYCLIIHSANSGEEKELQVAGCSQTQEIGKRKKWRNARDVRWAATWLLSMGKSGTQDPSTEEVFRGSSGKLDILYYTIKFFFPNGLSMILLYNRYFWHLAFLTQSCSGNQNSPERTAWWRIATLEPTWQCISVP